MSFFQNLKKFKLLLLIATFLLGSTYLFYHFFPLLTEKIISVYLHKQGFKDFQFRVDKVSANELLLSSFKFGKEDEIKISKIKFIYSFEEVIKGKVNTIEVEGLSYDLQVKNGKISSGVTRSMPKGETKKTGYLPLILPFNKLAIRGSSVNIHSYNGKITASLSGNIDNTEGNNFIKSDVKISIAERPGPQPQFGMENRIGRMALQSARRVEAKDGRKSNGLPPVTQQKLCQKNTLLQDCSKYQNRTLTAIAFVEGSPSNFKGSFNLTAEGGINVAEIVDIPQGSVSLKSDISFQNRLLNLQIKNAKVDIGNLISEKKYNTSIEPFQLKLKKDTKAEFQVDFSNNETPGFSYNLQLEPVTLKVNVQGKTGEVIPVDFSVQEAQFNGGRKAVNYKLKFSLEEDLHTPIDEIIVSLAGTIDNPIKAQSIKSDFNVTLKGKSGSLSTTGYFDWSPSILHGHIDLSAEGGMNVAETIYIPAGSISLKSDVLYQNRLLNFYVKDAKLRTENTAEVKKFNARVEPFLIALNRDKPVKVLVDFRKNRALISDEISFAPSKIKAIVKDKKGKDIFILFDFKKVNVGGELGFPKGKPLDYKIFAALKESDFSIPEFEISAEGIGIKAEISSQDTSNKIKISFSDILMKHDKEPPYIAPLFMKGELNYLNGLSGFDGTIEGFDKKLFLDFSGTYETKSNKGKARFKLFPVLFSKNSISPADIFPVTGKRPVPQPNGASAPWTTNKQSSSNKKFSWSNIISNVEGEVEAGGTLSWHGKKIKPDIFVGIRDLSFTLAEVNFAGINGIIKFDGITPLSTPQTQTITILKAEAGLPLENGKIDFNIKSEKIFLENIKWDWAGGTLHADPFHIQLTDPKINKLILNISEVQLDEILSLIDRKGLSGTGVLSGKIPVEFFDDLSFSISKSFLEASREGGVLRYRPAAASFLSGDNQNVKMMFKALDDFHYKKLKFTLNGGTKKGLEGSLALYGSNPALYDGRPIELNVKLTGEIMEVLESVLGFYKIPGQLQEHLLE